MCAQESDKRNENGEDNGKARTSRELASDAEKARRCDRHGDVPPKTTTLRWKLMLPATTAPSPSSAARLKTFDPRTTPAPTVAWWCTKAVMEAVTSGASAARAATIPRGLQRGRGARRPVRDAKRAPNWCPD